jgi:hypothetical protein
VTAGVEQPSFDETEESELLRCLAEMDELVEAPCEYLSPPPFTHPTERSHSPQDVSTCLGKRSLADFIPTPPRSLSFVDPVAEAAAKKARRKIAIRRYMEKKARRNWQKRPTYSLRSEVATARKRDNGRFVKSNKKFVSASELF